MRRLLLSITALILTFPSLTVANSFKTEQWTTSNGVKVVFYKAMEVPMLDIHIAFAAGSAYDGKTYGLSALTAKLMNQGSAGLDATAIAEGLENTGAQLGYESSKDMAVYRLKTLIRAEALGQSTTLFSKIIAHPEFPSNAFEREKNQQLMAIKQAQDSPEDVANRQFFKTLYQNHPYAHPATGTTKSVKALTRDQVLAFYKQFYVANNATMVLVGALDSPAAHRLAEKLSNDLPKGKAAQAIPKATFHEEANLVNIPFPSSQTVLRLGQIGIDHHHPDYFPLLLGNYILGGGTLVSRLGLEVREKRGLTYGVASQFAPMMGEGPFLISLSTKNKSAQEALAITQDILARFIKEGPSAQELKAAKQYLSGSFPLSLSSNSAIASLLLRMAFYKLPQDYLDSYVARINRITLDEVKLAFQKQVHPKEMLVLTVGRSVETRS